MSVARATTAEWITLGARATLGAIFVYLGAVKALDPIGFLKLVRQFEALPQPLALNTVAALLPWFEVFCGGLLLAGIRPRGAALVLLVLLTGFTSLIALRALAIYHGQGVPFCTIRFDCGCGASDVLICSKLAENSAQWLLAAFVLFRSHRQFCLWPEKA